MRAATADLDLFEGAGQFRIWAKAPGQVPLEISWVRGVPTEISEFKDSDPYGPESMTLVFPHLSMYDAIGQGELAWLAEGVDVDVEWVGALPAGYPYERWVWEGYMMPFDYEQTSVTVSLLGATYQLDNYLAKPEFATQPMPYEVAIARCWQGKVDLRLKDLAIEWPSWWAETYVPVPKQLGPLIPTGVRAGDNWTGMLTRETGSWDALLTSYIQTMLTSMYTARGRWALDLDPGRKSVLRHREFKIEPDAATIVIEPGQPGVKPSLSEDWTQSANVFYGQTKALSGEAYSGMQVIGDGQAVVYKPLAALRQVEPTTDRNTWLQQHRMRKESLLQLQDGLTALESQRVGASHLAAFADPGITGTIELTSDPKMSGGDVLPRALIKGGMSVQLAGFKGEPDGIMLHVASVSVSGESVTLTVDSKYRDKMTIDEIRLRGRDALSVPRALIGGKYRPTLPDQLFPWNYAEGSGYIPSSPSRNARRLFEDMPPEIEFPWTEWTTQRPPRLPAWKTCYIPIPPKNANADWNWAYEAQRGSAGIGGTGRFGFPIRMSQFGTSRMLQLAAYDADGNVMAVPFHFSLYYQRQVNVASMPKIPAGLTSAQRGGYAVGKHYPFFPQAWETFNVDGTSVGTEITVATGSVGLIAGFGTDTVRAGHWPGSSAQGDPPTGLLVDESPIEWNLVGPSPYINPYKINDLSPYAGYLYCMIYCDAQGTEPVYFMGRMFRTEPGVSV